MKKSTEITFISLLENEEFIQIATNYNWNDRQVREYLNRFSEKEETISYAFHFIKSATEYEEEIPKLQDQEMRDFILAYGEARLKRTNVHRIFLRFSKIAAVLIISLLAGYWGYDYFKSGVKLEEFAKNNLVESVDNAVIVLSDGSKHNLVSPDAAIEYSPDGSEIIVKEKQAEEEKLSNSQDKGAVAVNQIVVPFGHRHNIILSDGTKVQLNSGSQMVFPAEFTGKTREVFLKGEGYFEVAKNKEKPFIVKTDFLDLKVLGTSFNVSSYPDEQMVTTVLVEGKVAVYENKKLFGGSKQELMPGQGCFYSVESSKSLVKEVDVYDYVSWKDGIFQFKDQTLADVANRVRKFYNKNIQIETAELSATIISGKLVLTEDIEKVMENLAYTLEADFEKVDENTFKIK
jgi:hypothetical protein